MKTREELSKKVDKIRSEKDKILNEMNDSIKNFIVNTCNLSNNIQVSIMLDLGYISKYTNHRLEDIDIRINLFANGEDTNIKVKFEGSKMYIKNDTIVGLSKEDKEDLVYINSYKILHHLLTDRYEDFKTFVISKVGQDIKELGNINTKISELDNKIRKLDK